jgi:soluble lytic murein transglycosylase-like protein
MRILVLLAILFTAPVFARAEIAVLANGSTLSVRSWRLAGRNVILTLCEGGEIGVPALAISGLLPDEIGDAVPEVPARGLREDGLRALVTGAAERHGVDPDLVLAVVAVESGFRREAVSHKGAQGLMQLMPATAASLGVTDPFDAAQNLDGGARHLGALLETFRGDLEKALAAYNAGAGAVERHGGVPPYPETRAYVRRVLSAYRGGP